MKAGPLRFRKMPRVFPCRPHALKCAFPGASWALPDFFHPVIHSAAKARRFRGECLSSLPLCEIASTSIVKICQAKSSAGRTNMARTTKKPCWLMAFLFGFPFSAGLLRTHCAIPLWRRQSGPTLFGTVHPTGSIRRSRLTFYCSR